MMGDRGGGSWRNSFVKVRPEMGHGEQYLQKHVGSVRQTLSFAKKWKGHKCVEGLDKLKTSGGGDQTPGIRPGNRWGGDQTRRSPK